MFDKNMHSMVRIASNHNDSMEEFEVLFDMLRNVETTENARRIVKILRNRLSHYAELLDVIDAEVETITF